MRVKPSLAVERIRIGTYNTPLSWNLPDDTVTRINVGLTSALNPNTIRAKPDQGTHPSCLSSIRALSLPSFLLDSPLPIQTQKTSTLLWPGSSPLTAQPQAQSHHISPVIIKISQHAPLHLSHLLRRHPGSRSRLRCSSRRAQTLSTESLPSPHRRSFAERLPTHWHRLSTHRHGLPSPPSQANRHFPPPSSFQLASFSKTIDGNKVPSECVAPTAVLGLWCEY